ncbi:hypothetical protein WCLP8_1870007 [uncultured Gammaproteobacteria bacterium]
MSIALMNHDFPASSSLYPSAYGALPLKPLNPIPYGCWY